MLKKVFYYFNCRNTNQDLSENFDSVLLTQDLPAELNLSSEY